MTDSLWLDSGVLFRSFKLSVPGLMIMTVTTSPERGGRGDPITVFSSGSQGDGFSCQSCIWEYDHCGGVEDIKLETWSRFSHNLSFCNIAVL